MAKDTKVLNISSCQDLTMRKSRIEVEGDVHLAEVDERVADCWHGLKGLACVTDRPYRSQADHQYAQYVEHHFLRTSIMTSSHVSTETFNNLVYNTRQC